MSSLSFLVQWVLSSSLLVGAYLLGRRAQQDTRLLPAAIILFLFAVPIPIVASLFPGPDQLREFTSIKYGPPIAAFVEAGEKAFQQSPFKPLGNVSNGAVAYNELPSGAETEEGRESPDSKLTNPESGLRSPVEALNNSSNPRSQSELRPELQNQTASAETVERNASHPQPKSGRLFSGETVEIYGQQITNRSQRHAPHSSTAVANGSRNSSLQFCLDTLAVGTWRNTSLVKSEADQTRGVHNSVSVEKRGSAESLNQQGSHMLWEWDPLGVQLCNFTTWGRLESVQSLARLSGSLSSADESTAERAALSGPQRTVSAALTPSKEANESVTRIVVAGDSQGRLFALALLLLLRGIEEDELMLFQRKHQDWNVTAGEGSLCIEFWWAPFASNVTERLQTEGRATEPPAVMVLSFGLWHMLYTNDPEDYARNLQQLTATLQETYRIAGRRQPLVFWLNSPLLITEKLNTEAKRARLTESMLRTYNEVASESGLLLPDGPGVLLDLFRVTGSCGESCAPDGMHYISEAYGVVVQVMLKAIALTRS
ncbi:hypothetical protein KFL_001320140 [Klebsormidium nitens]|uniref:Uncharacterized protein n=1 Tax=Klebsormidium nitens TaxID=105231 RepID=A0A1Y1I2N6_KLENI|nr:hypothetical protein KFL_001320140 [Klebsormidium nitens]|eukprot:GAQ83006.1 hypothetical protein KFL_001320140 [Klebsormidium nitens]